MTAEVTIHPFEKIGGHLLEAVRAAIEDRSQFSTLARGSQISSSETAKSNGP